MARVTEIDRPAPVRKRFSPGGCPNAKEKRP